MLNIGPGQLVLFCIIALIVLGPEKLPQAMRTVGRVTGEMRRLSNGFQSEMRHAFEEERPQPASRPAPRPARPPEAAGGGGAGANGVEGPEVGGGQSEREVAASGTSVSPVEPALAGTADEPVDEPVGGLADGPADEVDGFRHPAS